MTRLTRLIGRLIGMLIGTLLLLSMSDLVSAQTNTVRNEFPKIEIGGHSFSFSGREAGNGFGAGGRFTYNLTRNVAVDTELNAFLDDEGGTTATSGFAGAKIGVRNKLVGVFIKARPGFMTNFARPRPDFDTSFAVDDVNRFAFDVGGVVEIYPSRHTAFRVDVGDTIIPFGDDRIVSGPRLTIRPGTTHNLQYSLGFSLRF